MQQRHERIAADDELKSQHAGAAKVAKKLPWLPHVHEPGLHPAPEPARALPEPPAAVGRRFFISGGGDHCRSVAETGKPNAEIGILGYIVWIPAANFTQRLGAKMISKNLLAAAAGQVQRAWAARHRNARHIR